MTKFKSIFVLMICTILSLGIVTINVKASTFSANASTNVVAPGGSFTVTISGQDCIGRVNLSVSNGSLSASEVWVENSSASVTVYAGTSGSVNVTATPVVGMSNGAGEQINPGSRSTSVRISSPNPGGGSTSGGSTGGSTNNNNTNKLPSLGEERASEKSSNVNLDNLTVSEGTLSPTFAADITEYTLDLSATIDKINVQAKASDSKASVTGIGEKEVKAGDNELVITVTAENGDSKNYVIKAHVDEKPDIYLSYEKKKLGVVRNLSNIKAPEGFEDTTILIKNIEVKAWKNNAFKMIIIYLQDEKSGDKNFYIYDTKLNKIRSIIKPVGILGNNVYIIDIDKDLRDIVGLKYEKLTIDGIELMGWSFEDKAFKNYNVIYVMDEHGKMQYFQYEKTQKTLQLYSGAAPINQKSLEKLNKEMDETNKMKMVFMILAGVFALTTIVASTVAMKHRNKKR